MSAKAEKPQLGGTRIRQRKRSINAPLDPETFAEDVVALFQEAAETVPQQDDVEAKLLAGVKALETGEFDFSRYGDTLFELLFTGGRISGGSMAVETGDNPLATNIFAAALDINAVKPYITAFQHILRRRPFLVKNLENVMKRLLQSIEHFPQPEREKIGLILSQVYIQKLGVPPENVFTVLLNDALVAKGSVVQFLTSFFKWWLKESTLDDLTSVLRRGKVEDRLLEFFPQQRRTQEAFNEHFMAEGLEPIVQWSKKRFAETKLKELKDYLAEQMQEGTGAAELAEAVKQRRKDAGLQDADLVAVVWEALMAGMDFVGKNPQQVSQQVVKGVRTWAKVLQVPVTARKLEMELLYKVQTNCYENPALIKAFADVVRNLYDKEVVTEDTIITWYKRGTNPKGRSVFVQDMEKFVTWLEEAEEEGEEDD